MGGVYRYLASKCHIIACGSLNTGKEESPVFVLSPNEVVQEYPLGPGDQPTSCRFGDAILQGLYITTETGKLYQVGNTNRKG